MLATRIANGANQWLSDPSNLMAFSLWTYKLACWHFICSSNGSSEVT